MSQPTDYQVTNAMILYGGSFVAKLGELFNVADPQNQAALKTAFPAYWAEYAELHKLLKARGEGPK